MHAELSAVQLSFMVGVLYLTTARPIPGELSLTEISEGHFIVGGCASLTVTTKLQGAPVLPKQMTLLVPTGKTEPDPGLQVNAPQLSPEAPAIGKVTRLPHCPAGLATVTLDGQAMLQGRGVMDVVAVAALSPAYNSGVEPDTVAVLETLAPL